MPARAENCGKPVSGEFCSSCGQATESLPRSAWHWIGNQISTLVGYDSRLGRSFAALIARPGMLTRAYLTGQRARFLPPLSLYLVAAGVFFFLHTVKPFVRFDPATRRIIGSLSAVGVGGVMPASDAARLKTAGVSLDAFAERFGSAASTLLPVFLFISLLLFAGIVALLHRRSATGSVTHAVFALHWGAFFLSIGAIDRAFAILGVRGIPLSAIYSLATLVYLVVALRNVYRISWVRSAVEGVVLQMAFYVVLAVWLASVSLLAVRLSLP
jgi:hypothetical protein